MSKQSRSRLLAFVLVTAVLCSTGSADALGVTPGRSTIDFSPGASLEKSFTITNNDHRDFNAYIYVEDELGKYVQIDDEIICHQRMHQSHRFINQTIDQF